LIIFVFQNNLATNIKLTDYTPIYIMLAFVVSGVLLNILFGALQGVERYFDYASGASLLQFTKLALGIFFVVILGYSYNGALFAMSISNIILIIIAYLKIKDYFSLFPDSIALLPKKLYGSIAMDSIPLGMMLLLFAILTNIDMIAVKHFVQSDEAGEYAAVSILSKIAIFLPSVLVSVLFPKIVSENQQGKNSKTTFMTIVLITIAVEVLFCIFLSLYSREIITLLFGARYSNASRYLLELTIAMSFVATANVFFHFFIAKQRYDFLYYSYGVAVLFGIFLWLAENLSIGMIVDIIFCWAFLLLLVNGLIYYLSFRT
jgi:O-antigen/teichoic acid export membrane protein